ncbi:MAG: peptidoglycan DD-metalloendopeptidase family protein [Deltaproteobacteria bacterium]|nr:peptidoglycan DD-metalloendopeptidase family protein [Deltaproteobacteria bacterium]
MGKGYSILICSWGGANVRRVALSRRALCGLEIVGVLLLCAKAYFFGDYLLLRLERGVVEQIKAEEEEHKERLARLYDQAEEMQRLLSRWKALKANVRASVPSPRGSGGEELTAVERFEERLASLHEELESLVASVPAAWPVDGRVSSGVGLRVSPWTGKKQFHSGLDIPGPVGTPVHAPADGRVRLVGHNTASGRVLVLDHGDGIATHYAHLSKIHVPKDALIRKGQWIADVGSTGRSTGPHLHYEVRVDGVAIDPRRHLLKNSS